MRSVRERWSIGCASLCLSRVLLTSGMTGTFVRPETGGIQGRSRIDPCPSFYSCPAPTALLITVPALSSSRWEKVGVLL